MLSKLMVLGVIVLIIVMLLYLLHDSPIMEKAKGLQGGLKEKSKKIKRKGKVKIADSPTFFFKGQGESNYSKEVMGCKKITIGSSDRCDITLDDEAVESVHVTVEKIFADGEVHYELVNYSKSNPVEHLNQEKGVYEYMGYKQGVILDKNEAFYIGETKVIVNCQSKGHTKGQTERFEAPPTVAKTRVYEMPAKKESTHSVRTVSASELSVEG